MRVWLAVSWLLLSACSGGAYQRGVFREGDLRYRIGDLPTQWKRVQIEDADLTFRHSDGGAILVNALCGQDHIDDVPLDVLVNQALFGVEDRQEKSRTPFTLDGRAALRAHIIGTVDGVAVELDLVVMKKDNCTFDFQLIAGKDEFLARRPDFEGLFSGFEKLPKGAR
jgi:hypothetical protein